MEAYLPGSLGVVDVVNDVLRLRWLWVQRLGHSERKEHYQESERTLHLGSANIDNINTKKMSFASLKDSIKPETRISEQESQERIVKILLLKFYIL